MGIDGISPKVLKSCALALYQPIHHLFVLSFTLFAKGVEVTSDDKIISFVSSHISLHQFGFRQNHSTFQQLLIFLNCIYESLGSTTQTDVIYLDFKKAFDSASHNELLFKFWSFGIQGNLWKWFRGYLTSRMQCVTIGSSISVQSGMEFVGI